MNKAQLIEALIAKHHAKRENYAISKDNMTAIVDGLGELVAEQLAFGMDVTLPGVGKLTTKLRKARVGRNPQTGDPIDIPAQRAVKFSATKALKDAL